MIAQDAALPVPGQHNGEQRRDIIGNGDHFSGRGRLGKRPCARCNRKFRPVAEGTKYCGACAARALARGASMRRLRLDGAVQS